MGNADKIEILDDLKRAHFGVSGKRYEMTHYANTGKWFLFKSDENGLYEQIGYSWIGSYTGSEIPLDVADSITNAIISEENRLIWAKREAA